MHHLVVLVLDGAERQVRTPRLEAGLLGELATSGGEKVLAVAHLALGDRPHAEVATHEEGTAGMREQHLEVLLAHAVHDQTGAHDLGHQARSGSADSALR